MGSVYRIGEFAERIGRSASTVRRWEAEGRLVAKRTMSGQRHLDEDDVRAALNIDRPEVTRRRIVYCRVSSPGQKDDLASQAVNAVVDQAGTVVAEDLTKTFTGRKSLGRNLNRRLAAWTKGVTAQALRDVSERRGSALRLVNAAYTSQVDPRTGLLALRRGDRLHLPGGIVITGRSPTDQTAGPGPQAPRGVGERIIRTSHLWLTSRKQLR